MSGRCPGAGVIGSCEPPSLGNERRSSTSPYAFLNAKSSLPPSY